MRAVLRQYAALDPRVQVAFRDRNGHISAALNTGLSIATGEFVAFLDQDDELAPDALYRNVALLNREPDADVIYSDEDKIDAHGRRSDPYFKPDWSPELLLSNMYVSHLCVYRRAL